MLDSASKGEKQFLKFYDENVASLYRYIYFRIGSKESAQDLTSECFFRYLRTSLPAPACADRQAGSPIKNPKAFLYQIARNLVVDFYRQSAKKPLSLEEITSRGAGVSDLGIDLQEEVQRTNDIELAKEALGKLKEDYQEIIILRYIDELEITEIAQILDRKRGAVRTLLSRALKALREELSEK